MSGPKRYRFRRGSGDLLADPESWFELKTSYTDIYLAENQAGDYAFLVDDICMEPMISNGDIIIISMESEPKAGDLILLIIDGKSRIRRYDGDLPGGMSIFSNDMTPGSAERIISGSWDYLLAVVASRKYSFPRYRQ